jgi:hypothetical protein
MKSKTFVNIVAMFVLAASTAALAQTTSCDKLPQSFSGQINAYTPTTTKAPTGPYEIRGNWSLKLKHFGTKADFSAAVNMILSDGWVLSIADPSATPPVPPNFDPALRNAHTHHITMTDADVTILPTGGFKVVGPAFVTLNGGVTPFAQSSPMTTIVITGGQDVEFSNFTLTLGSPASGHFGTDPLPGVVRKVSMENER